MENIDLDKAAVRDTTECWIFGCSHTPEKYCFRCEEYYCIHHCHFQYCVNCKIICHKGNKLKFYIEIAKSARPCILILCMFTIMVFVSPFISPHWSVTIALAIALFILGTVFGSLHYLKAQEFNQLKNKMLKERYSNRILPVRSTETSNQLKRTICDMEKEFLALDRFWNFGRKKSPIV